MKLSDSEKLILIMMGEIYKKLEIVGEIDTGFIESAITTNNTWGISHEYAIFENTDNPKVEEVSSILNMWSVIESSYYKLTDEDKILVEKDNNLEFKGFDGNNEADELSIARFFIENLNKFVEFKNRDINSHMPSIEKYRKMLLIFKPMREGIGSNFIDAKQLIEILK